MKRPMSIGAGWRREGHGVALATVVRTWGSSPRPAGSQLVIRSDGRFEGSVSGGCVEGAVVEASAEVIESAQPQSLSFGVSDEEAWDVGLACGGKVRIHLEPLTDSLAESAVAIDRSVAEGRGVARAVWLASGRWALIDDEVADEVLVGAAAEVLRSDRAQSVQVDDEDVFIEPHNPPLRMLIVGAVHISQVLAEMARLAGYAVTIIDPRQGFARADRFEGVELHHDWPDEALPPLAPDPRTAIVTLTHDPKLDDPALEIALRSDAFYVGALGSQRTNERRRKRLRAAGLTEGEVGRLHGPVGLPIGSRSPAEIAVSILAEVTATLRRAHS